MAEKLKKTPVDVTLIDKHNYHTFQPLLYQVATNLLDATIVGSPIRDAIHKQDNLSFHQTAVTQLDLNKRKVFCKDMEPFSYDYLVLALGAKANFFGVKGAAENAFPLYTLADATRLKKQILTRFELVEKDPEKIDDGMINFVIIGGGPTGVEISGAMAGFIYHDLVKDYPGLPVQKSRIILIDGGPALLRMFKEKAQVYTKHKLEELGVEVKLDARVEEIFPTHIVLQSGEFIKTNTVIWAGGLQGNPLINDLGLDLAPGNRLPVGPDLMLSGYPAVFVAGDIAKITAENTDNALPQLGSVAIQSGHHIGQTIARQVAGKATKPFKYVDKGTMATIAKGAAVLQMPRGRTLTGEAAWLSWGAVHLALLGGGGQRASAVVKYGFALFTGKRSSRIILDEDAE